MHWLMPLVLLVACGGTGNGKGDDAIGDECSVECPDGTRLTNFEAVIRGEGIEVIGTECSSACEPVLPCGAPNIPTVLSDGSYSCEPLEGYVTGIEPDADIDFSWAGQWVQP